MMKILSARYPLKTIMSHARMEVGKLGDPTQGIMCQKRAGAPRSANMNIRAVTIEATASNSPRMTIFFIGLKLYRYAGIIRSTAAAATPTKNVKFEI